MIGLLSEVRSRMSRVCGASPFLVLLDQKPL
jgi:hypothetical protein